MLFNGYFGFFEIFEGWKDIAQLKKELRELVREFRKRESRTDILDKILTE